MADAPECIVIGVDNSRWVLPDSDIFQNLCEAIEFYCRAKFNAHACFTGMNAGCGQVDLLGMFSFGFLPLVERFGERSNKKKRLVIFVGGLTNLSLLFAERTARSFRGMGIAIDVIHFYIGETPEYPFSKYPCGRTELEALIKLCNDYDKGNHRFVHVGSTRSIRDALSESCLL